MKLELDNGSNWSSDIVWSVSQHRSIEVADLNDGDELVAHAEV